MAVAKGSVLKRKPAIERFWSKVDKNGPLFRGTSCWVWIASRDRDGYPHGFLTGYDEERRPILQKAHRYSYETFKGAIPANLQLDHLCRNRACVNPDHLEPVTCKVNIRRGLTGILNSAKARKTHCPRGHPYFGENLIINSASGARVCRTCTNETNRRIYQTRRAAGLSWAESRGKGI